MNLKRSMDTEEEQRMLTKDEVNELLAPKCSQEIKEKIKILVVEDDRTTQLLYNKGLFNEVFEKKMVASGKEALRVYDEWHPDIILLDIYLLEMTGYQVLKAIRQTIEDKATTIVMATSLSGNDDILSCMKMGIEGYIVKPFQCMEIGAKILNYYKKREPERAQNAEALYKEMVEKYQVQSLYDKDTSKMKEAAKGAGDGASRKVTEDTVAKEADETPAEK